MLRETFRLLVLILVGDMGVMMNVGHSLRLFDQYMPLYDSALLQQIEDAFCIFFSSDYLVELGFTLSVIN